MRERMKMKKGLILQPRCEPAGVLNFKRVQTLHARVAASAAFWLWLLRNPNNGMMTTRPCGSHLRTMMYLKPKLEQVPKHDLKIQVKFLM